MSAEFVRYTAPKFELHRYNPRRKARGVEAAEMKVTWPDGEVEYLWMSEADIRANIKEFGPSAGLGRAVGAYVANVEVLPNTEHEQTSTEGRAHS
jgi:hypothetical protein